MSLSMTVTIGLKIANAAVHDSGNSLIIIVFYIETYLKCLPFNKLHELMDSNIFVILS